MEKMDFIHNPASVPTILENNPPSLSVGITPQFVAGVVMQSINADDSNTGGDTDVDGDAITYTCRYDNTIDGSVGSGLSDCTSLVNEDGSNPTFNASTGLFSGWRPALKEIGTAFEFEIVGTDANSASSSVIFSGTVQAAGPSAWLQGIQTTSSTNFNQATAYAIKWTSGNFDSTYFDHSITVNPEQLWVKTAGNYFIAVTVPLTSAVQRACVRHVALALEGLNANDVIEVYVSGTALTTGAATVTGAASLYAEYIRSSRTVFTATATRRPLALI